MAGYYCFTFVFLGKNETKDVIETALLEILLYFFCLG